MPIQLLRLLDEHAARQPDAPAIRVAASVDPGMTSVTYRQLRDAVHTWARQLDRELSRDAIVMLIGSNHPRFVAAFLAVLAANRSVFPVDRALTAVELSDLARRSGASAVWADRDVRLRVEGMGLTTLDLDDIAFDSDAPAAAADHAGESAWLLLQSSGTTGAPKIVRRSGHSLDAVARNVAESIGLRTDDRVLAAVPLSHSYGMENAMLAPIWAGACAVHPSALAASLGRGFDAAGLDDSGATVLPGVPALFDMIDRMGSGRWSLRVAYSAGAALPGQLADQLAQRLGIRIGNLYGCTEVGSVTYGSSPHTVGRPMAGVDILILDPEASDTEQQAPIGAEGQVAVRAPSMFASYHGDDSPLQNTTANGYFLTGDLGRLTDAPGHGGELVITGRLKLLIDVGGVKVNPIEVETVIRSHPQVAECILVPDPVSPTVNRMRAVVVPSGGGVDVDGLRAFLRQRLAPYKVPRTIEVRQSLPTSATGKVLRHQVLESVG